MFYHLILAGLFTTSTAVAQSNKVSPEEQKALIQQVIGHYAHYDIVAYVEHLPYFGEMRSMVVSYGFTDFYSDGDQLIESEKFCHSEYISNLPMSSKVDDSFTRAIVPPTTPVEFRKDQDHLTLYRPFTPSPVGVHLSGPDDPFPTSPSDPRIADDDHDGKPGVTVNVNVFGLGAQIYLARRESFAYTIKISDHGQLTGFVEDQSKQLVVGASISLLNRPQTPVQHPNLLLSPILLVPVDHSYDCERLMQERSALFPPNPTIWK